jgi:hypothetical protein
MHQPKERSYTPGYYSKSTISGTEVQSIRSRYTSTLSDFDQIVELWIEDGFSIEEMTARGFDRRMVLWAVQRIDQNEYKRKQAPPGLKVTSKAFGNGRRMPIAADYSY